MSAVKLSRVKPSARLSGLIVLLTISLALGVIIAWQSIRTERDYRATAERTLNDYARFAAFILATDVYRELGIAVLADFNGLPDWSSEAALSPRTQPGRGCDGEGFYFEYESTDHSIRFSRDDLAPWARQQLLDTLRTAVDLMNEASWRFRLVRINFGDAGDAVYLSPQNLSSGFGLRGLSTCLVRDSTAFVDLFGRENALPTALTGSTPADSLYSVSVGTTTGEVFYGTAPDYPDDYQGSYRLGPEFGDLAVSVTLNPAIATSLIIGGVPGSRLPLTAGLLTLNFLLVAGALWQLRSEYRSIADRSQFVSNVSHELRTPLSQILIFTELLKLDRLRSDEDKRRSLRIIEQETRRLIRLVENILQFSRHSIPQALNLEDIRLTAAVSETLDGFQPLADAKSVQISTEIPEDTHVYGDRNAIRQILINLLDNAVKYGPTGQTITIHASQSNGTVRLSVADQGPGIPSGDRERVWEGFHRLARDQHTGVSGSGIGLSVVKNLADKMGGGAEVRDSATGGAEFVVTLRNVRGGKS